MECRKMVHVFSGHQPSLYMYISYIPFHFYDSLCINLVKFSTSEICTLFCYVFLSIQRLHNLFTQCTDFICMVFTELVSTLILFFKCRGQVKNSCYSFLHFFFLCCNDFIFCLLSLVFTISLKWLLNAYIEVQETYNHIHFFFFLSMVFTLIE